MDALTRAYRSVLPGVLRHRAAVLVVAVLAFVGAAAFAARLGNEFLPQVDDGRFRVSIQLPIGTPVEVTNRATLAAEKVVRELPAVRHVFAAAGGGIWGRGMWVRPRFASMEVEVEPRRSRGLTASEWVRRAQRELSALPELADARVRVQPPRIRGLRTSTGTEDLEVKVFGDDLPTLQRLGEEVEARLGRLAGLSSVETSLKETAPELSVVVDRRRAADLGLDVGEVGRTVRTAVGGSVATRLTEGDREFDVRVRFDPAKVRDAAEMAALPLFPRSGAALRLRDVADVRESDAPQSIQRENQNRLVTIGASVLPQVWSMSEATEAAREALAGLDLPDGYTLRFGGQQEAIDANRRIFLTVVLLAVFLVFAVMAVQYESLVDPLVIMAAIPLALVGVVLALAVTGLPMSAPVLLGVILLAGIVVNNGILLVEYFEIRREGGAVPRIEAVLAAAPLRVRPIVMTVLTTTVGMLPLALNSAEGGELMSPMAVAVIGGLTLSTLLTLFVVPCLYLALTGLADRMRRRFLVEGAEG
jgi:multidrug efflux pump subunit AcrB